VAGVGASENSKCRRPASYGRHQAQGDFHYVVLAAGQTAAAEDLSTFACESHFSAGKYRATQADPLLRQRYSQIIYDVNEVGMVVQLHSVLHRHRRGGTTGAMK
jgi:hypothetical protein